MYSRIYVQALLFEFLFSIVFALFIIDLRTRKCHAATLHNYKETKHKGFS